MVALFVIFLVKYLFNLDFYQAEVKHLIHYLLICGFLCIMKELIVEGSSLGETF